MKLWDRIWLNVFYVIGICLLMILVLFGGDWPLRLRLVYMVSVILPMHACEEWQLPGGFHYQYNLIQHSDLPNRYPMNRLTDMLTVCIAEVVYLACVPFYQLNWVVMALCGFCLLEVFMHTFFGITMHHRFKQSGKKTMYNPGLVTAYLGFGSVAIAMIINLSTNATITGQDWGLTALLIAFMAVFEIFLPELRFRSKTTAYPYTSARYYEKFIQK